MNEILTDAGLQVLDGLVKLAITAFTVLVLPRIIAFIKKQEAILEAKMGTENYERARRLVETAVAAAEEEFKDALEKKGIEKKASVIAYLKAKGIVGIDDEDIDKLISAAVKYMNEAKQLTAPVTSEDESVG